MLEDTIIAISTPPGFGGLGVIRLSGNEALQIALGIFKPKRKRQTFPPRCAVLGDLFDEKSHEKFEEAFLTLFSG